MLRNILILVFILSYGIQIGAQVVSTNPPKVRVKLTLPEMIEMANRKSIESFKNKNLYLAKYWEFRSYKAGKRPSLALNTTPIDYDHSVTKRNQTNQFYDENSINSSASLNVNQNLVMTGGSIGITSKLSGTKNLDSSFVDYRSVPLEIYLKQPLNGYNEFKWKSRIEPIKFEKAKKLFLQSKEQVAVLCTNYFFDVIGAEINVDIAKVNFFNADTLYRIGAGRFEIGTVTQDELLDLELSLLNAKIARTKAVLALQQANTKLNSFLTIGDSVFIECIVPENIPHLKVKIDRALEYALSNNPDILGFSERLLGADEDIAKTRSQTGVTALINGNLGINKSSQEFNEMYQSPFLERQGVSIGLNIPIIDWGLHKGKMQMARSNRDYVEADIKQSKIDFKEVVFNSIVEFNMQEEQVLIAAKADTIARLGHEVTMQRFLIDKVDVIKLNLARNSLDAARRNYVDALRRYWRSFYTVRRLTLYDFENEKELSLDFDKILHK